MKKETQEMFLYFKMLFLRESLKKKRQMLIYMMTLRESEGYEYILEKVTQLGWLEILTNSSPSQLVELGVVLIMDHDGSWMKITSAES